MKKTRYLGFCPCCGKTFKVRSDKLVHHGYKRPGWGCIEGDCFGALRAPHELSPALAEDFSLYLETAVERAQAELDRLPDAQTLPYGRLTVSRDGEASIWERALSLTTREIESRIKLLKGELDRVRELALSWALKPLTTVEEQKAAERADKAQKAQERAQKRQERVSAKVKSLQKRIDSAVKRKNSRSLAYVWEEGLPQLRSIDRSLSEQDALKLIDRDNVWDAFGLIGATTRAPVEAMERRQDSIEFGGASKDEGWPL